MLDLGLPSCGNHVHRFVEKWPYQSVWLYSFAGKVRLVRLLVELQKEQLTGSFTVSLPEPWDQEFMLVKRQAASTNRSFHQPSSLAQATLTRPVQRPLSEIRAWRVS